MDVIWEFVMVDGEGGLLGDGSQKSNQWLLTLTSAASLYSQAPRQEVKEGKRKKNWLQATGKTNHIPQELTGNSLHSFQ